MINGDNILTNHVSCGRLIKWLYMDALRSSRVIKKGYRYLTLQLNNMLVSFDQVGLAVGDIAEIRQQASEKIAAMQVSASNGVFFLLFLFCLYSSASQCRVQ